MQTEQQTPEIRRQEILGHIESRRLPLPDMAQTMLQEGKKQQTDVMRSIAEMRSGFQPKNKADEKILDDFFGLEQETEQAAMDLQSEVDDAISDLKKAEGKEAPQPALVTLSEEEVDQADELVKVEIASAMQGQMNEARLKALLKTENGKWAAESFANEAAMELADLDEFDFAKLDNVAAIASLHEDLMTALKSRLENKIGPKYAERILRDPEYRKTLDQLQKNLSGRYQGEGSPKLLADSRLDTMVAVNEVMGEYALAIIKSHDIRSFGRGLDKNLRYKQDKKGENLPVMRMLNAGFDEDGELIEAKIEFAFEFEAVDEMGDPNGETANLFSVLRHEKIKQPDGSYERETAVNLDLIEIPPSVKGDGLAADIFRKFIPEYDKLGVDEITLHANIFDGGYAWASYGYGWDLNKMDEDKILNIIEGIKPSFVNSLKEAGLSLDDQKTDRVMEKLLQSYDEQKINKPNELKLTSDFVREMIDSDKDLQALFDDYKTDLPEEKTPLDILTVLLQLEEAKRNPLATTPQSLSLIGKDGPAMYRGEYRFYASREDFERAIAEGREQPELPPNLDKASEKDRAKARQQFINRSRIHAGKIGLLGSSWYGAVNLKGENRNLLDQKINRSSVNP